MYTKSFMYAGRLEHSLLKYVEVNKAKTELFVSFFFFPKEEKESKICSPKQIQILYVLNAVPDVLYKCRRVDLQ